MTEIPIMPQRKSGSNPFPQETVPLLVQRMATIGQLATSVIHDLNNLLTVVQLNADLLAETCSGDTESQVMIGEIKRASEEASTLTRNMLALTRGTGPHRETFDLVKHLRDLMALLKTVVAKRAEWELLLPEVPVWIVGDRSALVQVFMNLILNAVDAESTRPIQLGVVSRGAVAEVTVTDAGHGMTPETQARIFEPFFTTKKNGKGTGMGLTTVQKVVAQHGGEVTVSSQWEVGTTFAVRLPLASPPGDLSRAEPGVPVASFRPLTILLVEDDPGIRLIGSQILERRGHRILDAKDAGQARDLWRAHREEIDVLFTDLVLPAPGSGWELAREFQTEKADLRVLLTSGNQSASREERLQAGENFLPKPFRPDVLTAKIEALFD